MPSNWTIRESSLTAVSTAVAAGAKENPITGTLSNAPFWNALSVINADTVKIRIQFDDASTDFVDVLPQTAMVLEPEEGKQFRFISVVNKDGATAQTAGATSYQAFYKTKSGD